MNMRRIVCTTALVAGFCCSTGCHHSLEILNEEEFTVQFVSDFKKKDLKVALVCEPPVVMPAPTWGNADAYMKARAMKYAKELVTCERLFLQQVANSLIRQAGYDAYVTDDERAIAQSDVRVKLQEKVSGSAQGKNFLIGFPGCILFAHAWNGLAYDVKWNFQAEVTAMSSGRPLGSAEHTQNMDVRYASCGGRNEDPLGNCFLSTMWFLPPVGTILAIVQAGVSTAEYYEPLAGIIRDSGKLEPLADKVAQEIIRMINSRDFAQVKSETVAESQARPKGDKSSRRKDLEDLKNAGIITSDEYEAELKKLEGAGK